MSARIFSTLLGACAIAWVLAAAGCTNDEKRSAPATPAAPTAPAAPATPAVSVAAPPAVEDENAPQGMAARYAGTPQELEPFGKFVKEPYKRFFMEPLQATGPGRDVAEPDVATVKIGLLAPFERTHEGYIGKPILEGVTMAIEDENAAGGYKGKQFEIVARNDTGLWGASANEIARFAYDENCWGIIGSVDAANTHIAIRVALKVEIPVITPADTDPTFSETRIPWAFRNIPDDRQLAYTIVFRAFKDLNLQQVAIFRTNNRYGRFGVGEFRAGAIRFGRPAPIEINYEVAFENVNPDFTAQMERIEKTKPDGIVLWADAAAAGHIVKVIRARGFTMPIFACERIVNPEFLKIAGQAAEGVVAVYPFNPERGDPDYEAFAKKYEERTGEKPLCYAAYAYDSTRMFAHAIRKAGLNRWRIRDELQNMQMYKGVTGESSMDLSLTNRSSMVLCTVKNGKFVFGEPKVSHTW